MELLEGALATLGGGTVLVGASAAVARYLLDRHMNREMAVFRASMASDHAIDMEKLRAELAKEGKLEDRRYEYSRIMRRYEGPLQYAVYDLQSRLYNVVSQNLIQVYVMNGTESERAYVTSNTAYVIAQYFAWSEIIRHEIQFIECSTAGNTKALSALQSKIHSLWQTDEFGGRLRLWAGEQRAIGELMIEDKGSRLSCIGYARFLDILQDDQVPLLTKLHSDVESASADIQHCSARLVAVQHALINLLSFLDPECLRFPEERRTYVAGAVNASA